MAIPRGRRRIGFLWLAAILVLLLLLSFFWLPQDGARDCQNSWHPCLPFFQTTDTQVEEAESSPKPSSQDCPGQSFQVWRLLLYLKASQAANQDVLLEPYLQSWEELIRFMESLGAIVGFFSQKVKDKVATIRELSLEHAKKNSGRSSQDAPQNGAYYSIGSMVEAELKAGVVSFSHPSQSGCRTVLRLHRSLRWLTLLMRGLTEGANEEGEYRTPGDLCREAYWVALAPYHPWYVRQAAELVFVSLPERALFLQLVCVESQEEATPILHTLIHTLEETHARTQHILQTHGLLELP
ncbi:ceramide-1-phosphate transfer protein [Gadus chalcogrammus]|uniref:ceramide-1-phosphate transfer protein n=1 Tax=Gadus chalcogrammus TaxID=1042646 RepID=UPI0024C4C68E|nr:ceramide-1-phosphate transfer protein [Gadus chalcogrammus]